jgi:hypothetical protein
MSFENLRPAWTSRKPLKQKTPLKRYKRLNPISKNKERAAKRFIPKAVLKQLHERSGGQCEVIVQGYRCNGGAKDPHHVLPKGRGGKNTLDNLLHICRWCHRLIHDYPDKAEQMGILKKY